jgi:indolepyruvate ferredoxin oxidoreductase alpha subunit
VLAAVVRMRGDAPGPLHVEWSVNEKIAYEVALANSYTGKRSAVVMKQVGLNVAADPFMRSAYLGVVGGLVVIVADDPGPHSSQNEQDSRLFALFGKVPVLDPSCPAEARDMVAEAFELSERHQMPVMIRPTTRICHSRQVVELRQPVDLGRMARFERNPARWVATPAFLPGLHRELNDKLTSMATETAWEPELSEGDGSYPDRCVVASGIAHANVHDLLDDQGLLDRVDLYRVRLPFPLSSRFTAHLAEHYERVLVVEETDAVIELQLAHPGGQGRRTGHVRNFGELTPEVIQEAVAGFLDLPAADPAPPAARGRRPSLCAGCPHRASFYAIKKTFPKGIFPSDIGCYTLGLNLGAVDTVHCMGACISQAAGFHHAYAQDDGDCPTVVATIGDSTFFHAGLPALTNAVVQDARILVVILDNATTAMTGHQPVPHQGLRADGSTSRAVSLEQAVHGCGVEFLEVCDAYDTATLEGLLARADTYCRSPEGGVAVLIARHPCLMDKSARLDQPRFPMAVTEECVGCKKCLKEFECPALGPTPDGEQVTIDQDLCVGCGVCVPVCPVAAITRDPAEGGKEEG